MLTYAKELTKEYLSVILRNEGGYQNHMGDKGNYYGGKLYGTNMGVTPGAIMSAVAKGLIKLPPEGLTVNYMKKLDRETVRIIYSNRFYKTGYSHLLPHPLALFNFDSSVHHGPGGAITLLQRTLNEFFNLKLVVDGGFGPKTNEALKLINESNVIKVSGKYLGIRLIRFKEIVERDKRMAWAYNGWCNRVKRLAKENGIQII